MKTFWLHLLLAPVRPNDTKDFHIAVTMGKQTHYNLQIIMAYFSSPFPFYCDCLCLTSLFPLLSPEHFTPLILSFSLPVPSSLQIPLNLKLKKNLILDIECGVKMGSYAFCTSIKILLFFFHILWLYPYDIHNKDFDSCCNYCLLQCH